MSSILFQPLRLLRKGFAILLWISGYSNFLNLKNPNCFQFHKEPLNTIEWFESCRAAGQKGEARGVTAKPALTYLFLALK